MCSTPATNQVQSGARMFDSDATMNLTMKDLAGEPVSLLLPATPPKPVVVEVVLSSVYVIKSSPNDLYVCRVGR